MQPVSVSACDKSLRTMQTWDITTHNTVFNSTLQYSMTKQKKRVGGGGGIVWHSHLEFSESIATAFSFTINHRWMCVVQVCKLKHSTRCPCTYYKHYTLEGLGRTMLWLILFLTEYLLHLSNPDGICKDIQISTEAEYGNSHFSANSSKEGCFSPCCKNVIISVMLQHPSLHVFPLSFRYLLHTRAAQRNKGRVLALGQHCEEVSKVWCCPWDLLQEKMWTCRTNTEQVCPSPTSQPCAQFCRFHISLSKAVFGRKLKHNVLNLWMAEFYWQQIWAKGTAETWQGKLCDVHERRK